MTSNMGNMGDTGNSGGGAGSGVGRLPDRVDLPFVTETASEVWAWDTATNKWTLTKTNVSLTDIRVAIQYWLDTDWAAKWQAWLILADFAKTNWAATIDLTSVLWSPANQAVELQNMIRAAEDERADALGEILAQHASYTDFMAYFVLLLKITPRTHPKTFLLMHVAGIVGILVAMYFKQNPGGGRPPRARASQICPALMPPVAVPGHPSFPSGHATQSMLMALCLSEATKNRKDDNGNDRVWAPLLQGLSRRIARNREIAGLHFESDSTAGFELARQTFAMLLGVQSFKDALDYAINNEWN